MILRHLTNIVKPLKQDFLILLLAVNEHLVVTNAPVCHSDRMGGLPAGR